MSLSDDYQQQVHWRDWPAMLAEVPLSSDSHVLDLGCGPGTVTKMIAPHVARVTGIDSDPDMVDAAADAPANVNIKQGDICDLSGQVPVDGILAGFTPAYFPTFGPVLRHWCDHLNPGGWVAMVEVDDMLCGHDPLPGNVRSTLRAFCDQVRRLNAYDFDMGRRLCRTAEDCGLHVEKALRFADSELAFQGPASADVLDAWRRRFARMAGLRKFAGDEEFDELRTAFLACLADTAHTSTSQVVFVLARLGTG